MSASTYELEKRFCERPPSVSIGPGATAVTRMFLVGDVRGDQPGPRAQQIAERQRQPGKGPVQLAEQLVLRGGAYAHSA
jgi:hypothetical protein